ncbi:hypothetical protein TNCV_1482991 [Trichonephila clavipes]|nr:hypothetical protein TNCV_1482991 [Trichonephila clavipes]
MRQIAAKVPCGHSTVVRTLKRFSETNFIADRGRSGHDQEKHLYVKTADQRSSRKMATSKKKAFCVLQFLKTESAITVLRAFRIKFSCQPPIDNNILR